MSKSLDPTTMGGYADLSQWGGFKPLKLDNNLLMNFVNGEGNEGAAPLVQAYIRESDNKVFSKGGFDLTDIYTRYQEYASKIEKSKNDYQAYLDIKQQNPGRDSAILTVPDIGKNILGL